MTTNYTNEQYLTFGTIANYLALTFNAILTPLAMLGLPSKSTYDPQWTSHGYCVIQNATIPTEIMCFFPLAASALLAKLFIQTNGETLSKTNPLLKKRIENSSFGNFAHGFGHVFIWFVGEAPPPIEFAMTPEAIGNILMLVAFWVGTLRAVIGVSAKVAFQMGVIILTVQTLLGVPPELSFAFSQSVILFGQSLELMFHKEEYAVSRNGFLYFCIGASYLPLFLFNVMEMVSCSGGFMGRVNGHLLYDAYLGMVPFGINYLVSEMGKVGGKVKNV